MELELSPFELVTVFFLRVLAPQFISKTNPEHKKLVNDFCQSISKMTRTDENTEEGNERYREAFKQAVINCCSEDIGATLKRIDDVSSALNLGIDTYLYSVLDSVKDVKDLRLSINYVTLRDLTDKWLGDKPIMVSIKPTGSTLG